MTYEIEYEICLDEDIPNRSGYTRIEAESKKEAVGKFKDIGIYRAVIMDIRECTIESTCVAARRKFNRCKCFRGNF